MLRSLGTAALSSRVLSKASSPILRIGAVADVGAALALMHSQRVGALLVTDSSGAGPSGAAGFAPECAPVGILTERDILEKVEFDAPLASVRVAEIMTFQSEMSFAAADDSLDEVLSRMQAGGFRHMPILRSGLAIGIVSMRDVAHAIVEMSEGETAKAAASISASDLCMARSRTINLGSLSRPSCIEAPPSSSVADAVLLMRQWGAGSVLVPSRGSSVGASRRAFGIFTERDYIRLLGAAAALDQTIDPRQVELARCCTATSELVCATATTPAIQCLATMARARIRHLPVMREEEVDPSFDLGESDEPPAPPALLAVLSARDVLAQFLPPPSAAQVAATL
jgi:CBS domain-containing protein